MPATLNANGVVFGDGTSQNSVSSYGGSKAQVFTSSGTFTIPAGVTAVKATLVGSGGGGGGGIGSANGQSNGGAGGGTNIGGVQFFNGLTPGANLTVTVGAGGNPGAGSFQFYGGVSAAGATGGTTSVSSGNQAITTVQVTGANGGGGADSNPCNNVYGGNPGATSGGFKSPSLFQNYGNGGNGGNPGYYNGAAGSAGVAGVAGLVVLEW